MEMTKEKLAELLRRARKAHHEYEALLGKEDPDWATWYADFILSELEKDR